MESLRDENELRSDEDPTGRNIRVSSTASVREMLRSVQQDMKPAEVAHLNFTLDQLDRNIDMSKDNETLHKQISIEIDDLSSVINDYASDRNSTRLKKISSSSLEKLVKDLSLPSTVKNCALALEYAVTDSDIFKLMEVAIVLICESISAKKFNRLDVEIFFEKFVAIMPRVSEKLICKIHSSLSSKLFKKSVDSFTLFVNYFFVNNINDNNSVNLFGQVLRDEKMCKSLQPYDLRSLADIIIKYYEDAFMIYDLKLARSVSRFVRLGLPVQYIGDINFSLSKEDYHLQPLYYEFMMNGNNEERLQFIRTLVNTRRLHYFDRIMVVKGASKKTALNTMSQVTIPTQKSCCSYPTHAAFSDSNLSSKEVPFELSRLNNTTFAMHVRTFITQVRKPLQPLFIRLLFFCAWKEGIPLQSNIEVDTSDHGKVKRTAFLLNKFEGLSMVGMNSYVLKRIRVALPSLMECNFDENIYRLRDILEHASSVNVDRVNELNNIKKRVGKIKNGRVAVQDLFRAIFKSDDILRWDAGSLNDRLFYTYCYVKYPLDEFKRWTNELNENKQFALDTSKPTFYERFEDPLLSKTLIGIDGLKKYGYNFVQNSQLLAVFSALDATDAGFNFFGKLGTGQGKSLVFALLALQYVKKGKRVVIFSCYDHLSKRDHANFEQFFTDHGVTSSHLTSGSKDEVTADVMYADMDTFAQSYYKNIENLSCGQSDYIMEINNFNVALLDEFDALLIDAKVIGRWVYNQFKFYELQAFQSLHHAQREFYDQLRAKPFLQDMFQRLERGGCGNLIHSWTAGFSSHEGGSRVDKFGHKVNYVGGEWDQLSKGKFSIYYAKLDIFSYLLGVKTVVGLSGSISREQMGRFETAMKKPGNDGSLKDGFKYMEVPPFYGLRGGKNSTRVIIENCSTWRDSVANDMDVVLGRNPPVPILVFGDINDSSDWDYLKSLIEIKARHFCRKHQTIKEESQVDSMALTYASDPEYITLATHIVGRGADFKVLPDVNRAGGLHVLITGVPNNDARLLVQMIGRTARMDNDGSHSIILRGEKPSNSTEPITVEEFDRELSATGHMVNSQLAKLPYDKALWQRWILIFNAIQDSKMWPSGMSGVDNIHRAGTLLSFITSQQSSRFIRELQMESAIGDDQPNKKKGICTIM